MRTIFASTGKGFLRALVSVRVGPTVSSIRTSHHQVAFHDSGALIRWFFTNTSLHGSRCRLKVLRDTARWPLSGVVAHTSLTIYDIRHNEDFSLGAIDTESEMRKLSPQEGGRRLSQCFLESEYATRGWDLR